MQEAGAGGRGRWQEQVAGAGGRCRWQEQVAGAGGRGRWQEQEISMTQPSFSIHGKWQNEKCQIMSNDKWKMNPVSLGPLLPVPAFGYTLDSIIADRHLIAW